MSAIENSFQRLAKLVTETTYLKSTVATLEWDQQTKMPAQAAKYRSEQLTYLAGEIHKRQTSSELMDLLDELDQQIVDDDKGVVAVTVRELKRESEKKQKLPQALVEELASTTSLGQQLWQEARQENDFARFAPTLEKIFQLKRDECDAVGYQDLPYDVLLDDYEPATSTREVENVLNELKDELVPLVAEIADSGKHPDESILNRNFPIEQQKKLGQLASTQIGFDYDSGRLDIAHHPFCTELGPMDTRITTRYDKSFFSSAFFGTLHEAGHGIYEQGLLKDQYGFPPGHYCSLGIHESQSRMWENLVGRSFGFWQHFYPLAQQHFADSLGGVSLEEFYSAVNAVRPSLIRVEADEATYNLHIIIRFQLENSLINGQLQVSDLPEAWNEKYQTYLGIIPDSDANGVLQDIHWSAGLVGYFSTYSLGNIYASQFFDAAKSQLGDLESMFQEGNFSPLRQWLNEKIHVHGQTFKPQELVEEVTGSKLSHSHLIRHLREKLSPIYGLSSNT